MSETSADELDGDRPEFGEAPNLVEIRCQWQSRSFVESGLPFLGQDSYVMNIMATLHSVPIIVFGLLDTIYWLKKPQFHASDLSGMPVNLVNYRSLFSLVTCIRRAFNQYLNRELVMVTTKSGFVHLFEYQDENLVELAEIRNSGLGDDISIWSVALLRSRPILAASSNTKLIELIDLTNITEPRSIDFLSGHDHNIPSIDISDDDQLLISASIDGSSRIWHIASRTLIYSCVESPDVWGWAAMFFPVDYSSNASLYDSNNVDFNERFDQLQRWTQNNNAGLGGLLGATFPPMTLYVLLRNLRSTLQPACIEAGYNEALSLSRHLAVFCNQINLFLCNARMHVLDYYQFCTDECRSRPTFLFTGARCRVVLLRSIPELSLILFCCSHARQVTMLRVVQLASRYRLEYVGLLPERPSELCSIIGMDISYGPKVKTEFDHEDFWCVHLLYANGVLCCFEVQRSLEARSLDLLPVTI